jgi:hypothetical protein
LNEVSRVLIDARNHRIKAGLSPPFIS